MSGNDPRKTDVHSDKTIAPQTSPDDTAGRPPDDDATLAPSVTMAPDRSGSPGPALGRVQIEGYEILEPYLSSSIVMRESHALHTPLGFFKPRHKLSQEFSQLAANLMGTAVKSDRKNKTAPVREGSKSSRVLRKL